MQARFQHAELVSKRQKLEEYKGKLHNESKRRSAVLSTARESERKGRESRQARIADIDKAHQIPQSSSSDLLELTDRDYLLQKLPRLISENINSLQNHAIDLKNQTALLERKRQALNEFIDSFKQGGGGIVAS